MKVQFIKDDNYQTMYIDGKQVLSGHSLYPEDVVGAIIGSENVTEIAIEDFEEDELTIKDNGDILLDDVLLWENGVGHPQEFPFEY